MHISYQKILLNNSSKSLILFTGAHHAREIITTINDNKNILIEGLHGLIHIKLR